jgi:hypothetical protein
MSRRWAYVVVAFVAVAATVVGVLALVHPAAFWLPGMARKSDAPPVWGVGFLAIPLILIALGLRRLWDRLAIHNEARHQRRRRKAG